FFSSRRRHTRFSRDWSSDVCSSDLLRPQAQRLYSIASSRKRVGEEAHLTVDVLRYQAHGQPHLGAASAFLAALEEGAQVPVYIRSEERRVGKKCTPRGATQECRAEV